MLEASLPGGTVDIGVLGAVLGEESQRAGAEEGVVTEPVLQMTEVDVARETAAPASAPAPAEPVAAAAAASAAAAAVAVPAKRHKPTTRDDYQFRLMAQGFAEDEARRFFELEEEEEEMDFHMFPSVTGRQAGGFLDPVVTPRPMEEARGNGRRRGMLQSTGWAWASPEDIAARIAAELEDKPPWQRPLSSCAPASQPLESPAPRRPVRSPGRGRGAKLCGSRGDDHHQAWT